MKKKVKPSLKPEEVITGVNSSNLAENIKFLKKLELQQAILSKLVNPGTKQDLADEGKDNQ